MIKTDANHAVPGNGPCRVLYVSNVADLYGAGRCLLRLIKALDRGRYDPVVVLPHDGLLRHKLEALGVEVVFHPKLSIITRPVFRSWRILLFFLEFPASVFFLWRLIRRRKIHVVHTNVGVILSSGLAARLAGVGHLWHIRDLFHEFQRFWKPFSMYILWSSDAVIAISQAVADQFGNSSKVAVIYDGCSLDEFKLANPQAGGEFRRRFGLGMDFVVACVGRIKILRKGQEVLIQAAAILKARGLRLKVLIIGAVFPGNESSLRTLKQMVRDSALEDVVIFTGELEEVKPAYAAMNVLVMPSAQPEPLGDVMMEAMAMKIPVIASNIGGPLEVVQDGVNGFLVPASDPVAMADKIELLMKDPKLRDRMGQAGPARVMERFFIGDMTRKIEDLYDKWRRGASK